MLCQAVTVKYPWHILVFTFIERGMQGDRKCSWFKPASQPRLFRRKGSQKETGEICLPRWWAYWAAGGRDDVLVLHIGIDVRAGQSQAGGTDRGENMRYLGARHIAGTTKRPLVGDGEEQGMFFHHSADSCWLRWLISQTYCDSEVLWGVLYFLHSFRSIFYS